MNKYLGGSQGQQVPMENESVNQSAQHQQQQQQCSGESQSFIEV